MKTSKRTLLSSESAHEYIAHVSALSDGVGEDILAKRLIAGLSEDLKSLVTSFDPITLCDTIELILLWETILSFESKEPVAIDENDDTSKLLEEVDIYLNNHSGDYFSISNYLLSV